MEWLPGSAAEGTERSITPEQEGAVAAFLTASLDALIAGDDTPDARRGLSAVLGAGLSTGQAVTTGNDVPARAECPGGNGQCWREQRLHGTHTYWVWVCECR